MVFYKFILGFKLIKRVKTKKLIRYSLLDFD